MDIQQLVDELETVISRSFRIPFTSNVLVNEDDLFDILDQMRISIPQEIKEAKRTEAERERILNRAQEEAARLVDMAKEKMMSAVDDHEVADVAKSRADEIVEQATREAEQLRADANDYVTDHLGNLEEQLLQLLTIVRNGLRHIQESQSLEPAIEPSSEAPVESQD